VTPPESFGAPLLSNLIGTYAASNAHFSVERHEVLSRVKTTLDGLNYHEIHSTPLVFAVSKV